MTELFKDHKLKITNMPSPNYDDRASGAGVDFLIMHYTGMPGDQALKYYLNDVHDEENGRISAHYLILENGEIIQVVDEDKRAWHAGRSYWRGIRDINSHSIGIELANAGHYDGNPPFAAAQLESLKYLCLDIMGRYHLRPQDVLGHSDIAPGRRFDPGPRFPWSRLAEENIGIMPDIGDDDAAAMLSFVKDRELDAVLYEHLVEFGYDPDVDAQALKHAFEVHYCPTAGNMPTGKAQDETILTVLLALLRRMDESN